MDDDNELELGDNTDEDEESLSEIEDAIFDED